MVIRSCLLLKMWISINAYMIFIKKFTRKLGDCADLGAGILKAETGLVSIGTSGVLLKTLSDESESQKHLHFLDMWLRSVII